MLSDVIGHQENIEKLKNVLRSGRIANAYIFSGAANVGKEHVAINFAKALNCLSGGEDACDKCLSCRKIDDGNHADVIVIRPEGTRLKIDQMRELQRQGAYRAMEGKYKVYIISEAEKMTAEAANSILKTLEEPSSVMVLILLTSIYSALLPTIRSRCQSLKFSTIPLTQMRDELISRFNIPESKAKWIAIRSQGKVGNALSLIKENKDNTDDEIPSFFPIPEGKANQHSLLSIFKKAENLDNVQDSLDVLLSWYRDLLLVKQDCPDDLLIHRDKRLELKRLSSLYSDLQIEKLIRTTLKTQNLIQRNVNSVLALEVLMLNISDQ